MRLWRISNFADLTGKGGELFAARWNHKGQRIVYCAEHPALCLLEVLVNIDPRRLPKTYQLLAIDVPENTKIMDADLPTDWQSDEQITRDYWDQFITENDAALLRVPSIVMPHAFNLLINPRNDDHAKLSIEATEIHPFDERFTG